MVVDKIALRKYNSFCRQDTAYADVAELADALDLGSSVDDVGVQVPSSAPQGFERFLNLSNLFIFHYFYYKDKNCRQFYIGVIFT